MPEPTEKDLAVTPIQIQNLTVQYGSLTALSDVTLTFASGKRYALVGQSGCGKSTLLRAICGLVHAASGSITLGDRLLGGHNLSDLRRRIGYVIQEGGLFPHMTAWQNVTLMARHLKWPVDRVNASVHRLADITQLSVNQLRRYPKELSGGQRQRVGIMRALMLDPDILLMDEPLGALDPIIRRRLQDDIKQIVSSLNKTVVLVTHDLAEAAYLCQQVVLMCEGQVAQIGTLSEFSRQPAMAFVRDFLDAHRPLDLGAQSL